MRKWTSWNIILWNFQRSKLTFSSLKYSNKGAIWLVWSFKPEFIIWSDIGPAETSVHRQPTDCSMPTFLDGNDQRNLKLLLLLTFNSGKKNIFFHFFLFNETQRWKRDFHKTNKSLHCTGLFGSVTSLHLQACDFLLIFALNLSES